MMQANKKQGIDVIDKVLEACYAADKDSLFIMSLMHQYEDRGFLTKKQIQGLHNIALKHETIPAGWIATLEATIAKLPNRDKTPVAKAATQKEPPKELGLIEAILSKYPQHKAAKAMHIRVSQGHTLTAAEITELKKFHKFLIEKQP